MSALAGPKWSNLPEAEKAAYNLKAKHEKRNASILESSLPKHSPGRLDSAGELISERRDYFLENEERRRRKNEEMKREITIDKNIPLYKFYFLDIQGFCELKELKRDRWLPCEIAIAEFSLIHGIHTTFHQFVDPGPIPMGYRYEAQSQSERTHMVPVEGFELATKNYRQLLTDLKSFTNQSVAGASPVCPLIFAKKDNVERVEYLLNWLTIKAGTVHIINLSSNHE
jgi:protein maelstrom